MADLQEQQAAEAVESTNDPEEKGEALEEQFAAADAAAEPEPIGVEQLASEQGWVPKDKFRGPEEKWKPAVDFIREGKNIQERLSRELKGVRETVETIKLANASILEERLRTQREELARKYEEAVERGDPNEAFKISGEIREVEARAQPRPSGPAPETQEWVSRNQRLMADPLARDRALHVCNAYANAGQPIEQQLANTEAVMRREFPHLFEDKAPASVAAPQSRSSAAPQRGEKTVADLPREAKAVAQDLVDRGLIPNLEAYSRNYFAAQAKGR